MIVNYLKSYRLQWGRPDSLSLIHSQLEGLTVPKDTSTPFVGQPETTSELPEITEDAPPYFTADTPPGLVSIIMNDWPYSGTSNLYVCRIPDASEHLFAP